MYGIIDQHGKVYAKSKKNDMKFDKLLKKMKRAYSNKTLHIDEVSDNAKCVGSDRSVTFRGS